MSSRRLNQDQYIRLAHTLSRRLQEVFKTSCQDVFTIFSRRLEDVLPNVFKTSSRHLAEMSSRSSEDVSSGLTVCLGHTSEEFVVSAENLQV